MSGDAPAGFALIPPNLSDSFGKEVGRVGGEITDSTDRGAAGWVSGALIGRVGLVRTFSVLEKRIFALPRCSTFQ